MSYMTEMILSGKYHTSLSACDARVTEKGRNVRGWERRSMKGAAN